MKNKLKNVIASIRITKFFIKDLHENLFKRLRVSINDYYYKCTGRFTDKYFWRFIHI